MADDISLQLGLVAVIILLVLAILYSNTRGRRRQTSSVVVIREGRLPGESASNFVCSSCGRRFRHTITFEDEVVKCPYCGSEVA